MSEIRDKRDATHDEQQVAIKLRGMVVEADDTRADGIWAIPAGGVMLRDEGYQFSVEAGRELARYVVIVRREPAAPLSSQKTPE